MLTELAIQRFFQLPYHVYLKDEHGKYLDCSQMMANELQLFNRNEIIGLCDHDLIQSKLANTLQQTDKSILKHKSKHVLTERVETPNRKPLTLLSHKYCIQIPNHSETALFGISLTNPLKASHKALLTSREKHCCHLHTQGFSQKQIAKQLSISDRTVEHHINHAKKILNCKNSAQLSAAYSLLGVLNIV